MSRLSFPARRRVALALGALLLAAVGAGCGSQYKLPTEVPRSLIPEDKSYQMIATWTGLADVQDVLLSQGLVFALFNHGGVGTGPRGALRVFPLARPSDIPNDGYPTLFNPVALAVGGDGAGRARSRLFVLDQGDTCLARANPRGGSCDDTTNGWGLGISNLGLYWRLREYPLYGGDTLSTFTDTTMAYVRGVAADAAGNVYVAGWAIVLVSDPGDPRLRTRTFQSKVFRYLRGPRYPGVTPDDYRLPGAKGWHRDTTWSIDEGSGIGTLMDPHGIEWGNGTGNALFAADYGKNWIQRLSDAISNSGSFNITDSGDTLLSLYQPLDVATDSRGYVYICDTGNRRVTRHDPAGAYVQRVDHELDSGGRALVNPVAVTADDSLVYVADRGLGEIIRYKRRK